MPFTTLLTGLALFSTTGWAGYVLDQDYMAGGNFFDQFTFWNTTDPTNGFVLYQTEDSANNMGLISSSASQITMGVDHTGVASSGRPSVRITSKASYESGLFIIDLDHMPGGICGTWPAFWLVGPDWPNNGEIDIIEGANNQATNKFTLHTGPGCSIGGVNAASSSANSFSGQVDTSNCDVNAAGQDTNVGCGITTTNTGTYGTDFNSNHGGVFATEWTDNGIAIYFFARGSVPSDIDSGSPNPSSWSEPIARFDGGGCNFGEKFQQQQIVFDTTFCGDWAGATFSDQCSSIGGTCENYVANNPSAFKDAYWSVNSLRVYQNNGGASPSGAPSAAPSSAAPQPSQSGWGSGAPGSSSFQTHPSAAPSGIPEISGTPGWPAPSGQPSGQPSASPSSPQSAAPAPSAAPSGQPSPVPEWSGRPQWSAQPSQTRGGHQPWHSGAWTENQNSDGSWSVGTPVQGSVVVEENVDKRDSTVMIDERVARIHSRHLAKHRRARHAGHGM